MHFKRNELKYYINNIETAVLLRDLSACMEVDTHGDSCGLYVVKSLYFDSHDDECLYQKQSGFYKRKKIRLRVYGDVKNSPIKLEVKRKNGTLVKKDSASITPELAKQLIKGNYESLLNFDNPVLHEVYSIFVIGNYRPKVIVEYERIALTMPISNIRVTFDTNLRSNINNIDLLKNQAPGIPVVLEGKQILEIKYDNYLPSHIKKIVSKISSERMAISKYTLARRFNKIHKWEDN